MLSRNGRLVLRASHAPDVLLPAIYRCFSQTSPNQGAGPEVTVQDIKNLPGYLRGPMGQSLMKAIGDEEWVEAVHPETGKMVWRNKRTGVMTNQPGPKPDTWTPAVDKSSGLMYWWNRRTGEATAAGDPCPGAYDRSSSSSSGAARESAAAEQIPATESQLWHPDQSSSTAAKQAHEPAAQDFNLQNLNWREGFQKTISTPVGRALLVVLVFGGSIELLRSGYDLLTST